MNPRVVVECACGLLMLGGIFGLFHNRFKSTKDGRPYTRGLGARVIQFAAVVLVVPAIVILGLEGILTGETVGTLFGTLIGYLLSGIGDFKPGDNSREEDTSP